MFWEMHQSARISQANTQAASAAQRAAGAALNVAQMEDSIDRLLLVNRAIWEIVAEQHGLSERDLDAKVQEIDLRDGRLDGKLTKTASECPDCQRMMSARHGRCLYCGHEGDRDPFDSVR